MVKVVVTGGLGFIGSHIVDMLVSDHEVVVYDDESTGTLRNLNPQAELVSGDVRDLDHLTAVMADADCLYHAAALPRIKPSFDYPAEFLGVNVAGTINCIAAAKAAGVGRVVFSSSSSVYAPAVPKPTHETAEVAPQSPYALQKYESELYADLLSKDVPLVIVALRYFNVYGPRSYNPEDAFSAYSSPVMIFLRQRHNGEPLTITWDGEQRRDFVYVADVARANLAGATSSLPPGCHIINIGSGVNHSVNEIAELIGGDRTYLPKREGEPRETLADIGRARQLLEWEPRVSLADGIQACQEAISAGKDGN